MDLIPTPSQTVGPFFHLGLTNAHSIARIAGASAKGQRITLTCTVYDGDGKTIPDAMVEVWQANSEGKYNHPDDPQEKSIDADFGGFGRLSSDEAGRCVFETVKPGRVPGPNGSLQAPHCNLSVFARGILTRLATRAYFEGDPANDEDPVLALVPQERRSTLLARREQSAPHNWHFAIHLCGPQETVFFDV